ncbi:MAG: hypothetical protein Q9219_003938 [cf. Caloplaca sp. 3 TL-2023]
MYSDADEKIVDDGTEGKKEIHRETMSEESVDDDPVYSQHEQRSIIHRVDRRLVLTYVVAFLAAFALVDFPDKADQSWRFLNTDERDFIIRRINRDRDDALPEPFTMKRFFKPALDIKLWIFALISL